MAPESKEQTELVLVVFFLADSGLPFPVFGEDEILGRIYHKFG